MITRIEIDGFKSLRGFSLELEPLTAIIGTNGAGKSNLFDVLQLLSSLSRSSITSGFKSLRGHIRDQFSQTPQGPGSAMSITTDLLLDPTQYDYSEYLPTRLRHFIRIERIPHASGLTEDLAITDERLNPIPVAEDSWAARHPEFSAFMRHEDAQGFSVDTEYVATAPEHSRVICKKSFEHTNVHFTQAGSSQFSFLSSTILTPKEVAADFQSIRLLHPEPGKLRLPSEQGAGTRLLPDGSNLPTALGSTSPEMRAQIRADLADLVPGFRSFEVVPSEDELRVDVESTDGTRVPARVLSDGTLRLLAMLTLVRTHPSNGLIAIEEPENGIYPGRLRELVTKLLDITSPRAGKLPHQIILNSHSPSLVAALSDHPEMVVFADLVRQRNGLRSTRMRHVRTSPSAERDYSTVSRDEIERYLESARPDEEA